MRLSAHHLHADYSPVGRHAKILLDGREVRYCIHADEEAGRVECARLNEKGHLFLIGDQVATETLRGKVRIEIPAEYLRFHFDAWMRERIEHAHCDFMGRTSRRLPCDWTIEDVARYMGAPI